MLHPWQRPQALSGTWSQVGIHPSRPLQPPTPTRHSRRHRQHPQAQTADCNPAADHIHRMLRALRAIPSGGVGANQGMPSMGPSQQMRPTRPYYKPAVQLWLTALATACLLQRSALQLKEPTRVSAEDFAPFARSWNGQACSKQIYFGKDTSDL